MVDENMLPEVQPIDLGHDADGRKIIYAHNLATPIQVLGRKGGKGRPSDVLAEASELQFREPVGLDIATHGLPSRLLFSGGGSYRVEFDEAKMTDMMGGLLVSDETPPLKLALVRQLSSKDWTAIAYELALFFTPAEQRA